MSTIGPTQKSNLEEYANRKSLQFLGEDSLSKLMMGEYQLDKA